MRALAIPFALLVGIGVVLTMMYSGKPVQAGADNAGIHGTGFIKTSLPAE